MTLADITDQLPHIEDSLFANIAPDALSKGEGRVTWRSDFRQRKLRDIFSSVILSYGSIYDDMEPVAQLQDVMAFLENPSAQSKMRSYFRTFKSEIPGYVSGIQSQEIPELGLSVQNLFDHQDYLDYSRKKASIAAEKLGMLAVVRLAIDLMQESDCTSDQKTYDKYVSTLKSALSRNARLSFVEKAISILSKVIALSTNVSLIYRRSEPMKMSQYFNNAWTKIQYIGEGFNKYNISPMRVTNSVGLNLFAIVQMTLACPFRVLAFIHKAFDTWTAIPFYSFHTAIRHFPTLRGLKPLVAVVDKARGVGTLVAQAVFYAMTLPYSLPALLLLPAVFSGAACASHLAYNLFCGARSIKRYYFDGHNNLEQELRTEIARIVSQYPGRTNKAIASHLKYVNYSLIALFSESELSQHISALNAAPASGAIDARSALGLHMEDPRFMDDLGVAPVPPLLAVFPVMHVVDNAENVTSGTREIDCSLRAR